MDFFLSYKVGIIGLAHRPSLVPMYPDQLRCFNIQGRKACLCSHLFFPSTYLASNIFMPSPGWHDQEIVVDDRYLHGKTKILCMGKRKQIQESNQGILAKVAVWTNVDSLLHFLLAQCSTF